MTVFDLKEGMYDDQLYHILDDHLSGEGTQQVNEFWYPRGIGHKDIPEKLHQVIKANNEYAIIKKFKSILNEVRYYLTGISDEGFYFLHEIPNTLNAEKMKLEELVNAINFTKDGFERIQGDLVIKFITVEDVNHYHTIIPRAKSFFSKEINPSSLYPDDLHLKNTIGPISENTSYYVDSKRKGIGNHKIIVEKGKVVYTRSDDWSNRNFTESAIVMGESLILLHDEHKETKINIPRNRFALLTMQLSNRQNGD